MSNVGWQVYYDDDAELVEFGFRVERNPDYDHVMIFTSLTVDEAKAFHDKLGQVLPE